MSDPIFHRAVNGCPWGTALYVDSDDGQRVVVKNGAGNVMLNCSRYVFDQCWLRGWFV